MFLSREKRSSITRKKALWGNSPSKLIYPTTSALHPGVALIWFASIAEGWVTGRGFGVLGHFYIWTDLLLAYVCRNNFHMSEQTHVYSPRCPCFFGGKRKESVVLYWRRRRKWTEGFEALWGNSSSKLIYPAASALRLPIPLLHCKCGRAVN